MRCGSTRPAPAAARRRKNLTTTSWRSLDLPHDWAIELPFDQNSDGSHGFKPVGPGYPKNSVGWYRRTFELPAEDAGKRIWLTFDGAFRDATVWVNGWLVTAARGRLLSVPRGHHGRRAFRRQERRRREAWTRRKFEGWFYEGAGIYRHVWLDKTAPVAIAPDGIFVYSEFEEQRSEGQCRKSRSRPAC